VRSLATLTVTTDGVQGRCRLRTPLLTGPDAMLRINWRAGGLAGHAPTPPAPSRVGCRGGTLLAWEERPVIVVLDEQDARRQLDAGRLACPGCGGRLGPWGHAKARQVRQPGGQRSWLRPRRACCAGCGATHVLLPAACLPRRADSVEAVGAALLAGAAGLGHRPIANSLGVPADTVRGWLRRARQRAPWLRVLATGVAYRADPSLGPIPPRGSVLADAVEALGQAAAALTRQLGVLAASPWQVIAALTGGRLLAPLSPSG